MRSILVLGTVLATVTVATAKPVPTLAFRLDDENPFRAPQGMGLNVASPLFSAGGNVLLRYVAAEGREASGLMLWDAKTKNSKLLDAPDGAVLTDVVQCADTGTYVYQVVNGAGLSKGIFAVDRDLKNMRRLAPAGKFASLEPVACSQKKDLLVLRGLTDTAKLGSLLRLQGGFAGNHQVQEISLGGLAAPAQKLSFLFKPSATIDVEGRAKIAFKYRYSPDGTDHSEGAPDGIVVLATNLLDLSSSHMVTRVEDQNAAGGKPDVVGFDNAVRVNAHGDLLYVALRSNGRRQLRHHTMGAINAQVVTTEEEHPEREILSFFPAALGSDGRVAFRTSESQNLKEFVWIWNPKDASLERVLKSVDDIEADFGPAQIGQSPQTGMSFYTSPEFNERGELLLGALVDKINRFGAIESFGLGFFIFR